MHGELVAFASVSLAVIVTPGQDTALTIRNTLRAGRPAGWATAAGVSAGQGCWTIGAAAGLASLLLASQIAFTIVKVLGAGYLLFLGLQALWSARRPYALDDATSAGSACLGAGVAFRQGLVSNLGNPKMVAFFGSLLPQFLPAQAASAFWMLLALGFTFCLLTFIWLAIYAVAVARLRVVMRRPKIRRTLDAITGTALIALGLPLTAQQRPG